MLKDGAQAHTGITEGTFYRDQAWHFYMIGRYLERARPDHAPAGYAVPLAGAAVPMRATTSTPASGTRCCARRPDITPTGGSIRTGIMPQEVACFLLANPRFRGRSAEPRADRVASDAVAHELRAARDVGGAGAAGRFESPP